MSLILTVDGPRWRAHLESVAAAHPGIVPVAKGNGYGFTLARLARKAQWLRDRGWVVIVLDKDSFTTEAIATWTGELRTALRVAA